jgi:hypothetical protein
MVTDVFNHVCLALQEKGKAHDITRTGPYHAFLSGCKWEFHISPEEDEVCLRITPKNVTGVDTIDLFVKTPRKGSVSGARVRKGLVDALLPRMRLLNLSQAMLKQQDGGT